MPAKIATTSAMRNVPRMMFMWAPPRELYPTDGVRRGRRVRSGIRALDNPPKLARLVVGDLPCFGKKFSGGHTNAQIVLMDHIRGSQPPLAFWLDVGH